MRDDNNKHENLNDQDEEFEETLSLCDLPNNSWNDHIETRYDEIDDDVDEEPFEFCSDMSAEIFPAEDIIIRGKIVPLKYNQQVIKRIYSAPESLQSPITRSGSANIFMRHSHSLDCREFHPTSRPESPFMERKRLGSDRRKSGWHMWMFGLMRFPSVDQMLLQDIKSRQVRRDASVGNKVPVSRSNGKGAWGLLKVLGCMDHGSVAVIKSFDRRPLV